MNEKQLLALLGKVKNGTISTEQALEALSAWAGAVPAIEDVGCAKLDVRRAWRCGHAEAVYAPGKTPAEIVKIVRVLRRHAPCVLVTRVNAKQAAALRRTFRTLAVYNSRANTVRVADSKNRLKAPTAKDFSTAHATVPDVFILTAGSADRSTAEEALETLWAAGVEAQAQFDVGVAGLHRLLAVLPQLRKARVVIVVAGMEGALPSVVGGLVAVPVVAVPTSTGYGVGAHGFAALAAMLNSCAAGVTVVNIDNGFGAAVAVLRMLKHKLGSNAQ
jgi:hypothetical protein